MIKTRYLVLFHPDEKIYIKNVKIYVKNNISVVYSHKYMKIKINSDDFFTIGKNISYAKCSNTYCLSHLLLFIIIIIIMKRF